MYSGRLIDELFEAVRKAERSSKLAPNEEASKSVKKPIACAKTRACIEQYFREQDLGRELQAK